MTTFSDRFMALARLTFEDPRRAARALLGMDVPLPARTAGLLLIAVVSALISEVGFLFLPPPADPITTFMQSSPLMSAAIQWVVLALSVLLVFQIGRSWGGRGSLADTLLVIVWLQVIMLGVQVVQLLALILSPPLAGLVNLGGMVLFFWLFSSFVAELHDFASRLKVFLAVLGVSFAIALILVIGVAVILGPEVLQNV